MAINPRKQLATAKKAVQQREKEEARNGTNKPGKIPVQRNFVGGGWDNSGEYGTFISLQLNKEKLMEIAEDKYGNIRLIVAARKNPDENSGQDVSVYEKQ